MTFTQFDPSPRVYEDPSALAVSILLVDDEPNNLTALESILAAPDRRLVRAASGPEALKYLLQESFAVVLLDVNMPGMDGFETAMLIRGRDRSRHTPIIFLTAAISEGASIARGYSLGAVDYLVKPIDPDILRSKVAVFLDLFRMSEQVRRQAETLAETTALLNSVLQGATEFAIIGMDLQGNLIAWNEGARRVYGYEMSEAIGQLNFGDLHAMPGDTEWSVTSLLEHADLQGKIVSNLLGISKTGKHFDVAVTLEQRLAVNGEAVGYVAIAQDTTARREAERQALRLIKETAARSEAERARDRLQQILDVLPEGVLTSDTEGSITTCNRAARALLKCRPPDSDLWGESTMGRFHEDGRPLAIDEIPLRRSVATGEVVRGEQILLRPDGAASPIVALFNSAPIRGPDGDIVGGVAVFQDISAIKDLERQKDEFLAAASHDLKNPLAIVKARVQLLLRQASASGNPDPGRFVDGLRAIDYATRRLVGMVNELLDIARLQMDRPIDLNRTRVNLAPLVRETVAQMQSSTDRHVITLNVECDPSALEGEWDAERLERVLVNLLSNAIKYSPAGGTIDVEVTTEVRDAQVWAVLRVRDTGIGIEPHDLPRIFERFYRGSNANERIDGAGIGLAGVRYITSRHGGEVTVESTPGKGSVFSVYLPLHHGGNEG